MSQLRSLRLVPDPAVPPPDADAAGQPLWGDPGIAALGEEVADLRDAVFSLGDLARRALPFDHAAVHVALQAAGHQLGIVEQLLLDASTGY